MFEMFNAAPVDDDDIEFIICWYPDMDNGSYGDATLPVTPVVFIELFKLSNPDVHQSWYVEFVWLKQIFKIRTWPERWVIYLNSPELWVWYGCPDVSSGVDDEGYDVDTTPPCDAKLVAAVETGIELSEAVFVLYNELPVE